MPAHDCRYTPRRLDHRGPCRFGGSRVDSGRAGCVSARLTGKSSSRLAARMTSPRCKTGQPAMPMAVPRRRTHPKPGVGAETMMTPCRRVGTMARNATLVRRHWAVAAVLEDEDRAWTRGSFPLNPARPTLALQASTSSRIDWPRHCRSLLNPFAHLHHPSKPDPAKFCLQTGQTQFRSRTEQRTCSAKALLRCYEGVTALAHRMQRRRASM